MAAWATAAAELVESEIHKEYFVSDFLQAFLTP